MHSQKPWLVSFFLLSSTALHLTSCNQDQIQDAVSINTDGVAEDLFDELSEHARNPAMKAKVSAVLNGKSSDFFDSIVKSSPTVLKAMGGDASRSFKNLDSGGISIKGLLDRAQIHPTSVTRNDLKIYVRFGRDVFTENGFKKGWLSKAVAYSDAEIGTVLKISAYLTQIKLQKAPKIYLADAPTFFVTSDSWGTDPNDSKTGSSVPYPTDAQRSGAAALVAGNAAMDDVTATNYGYNMDSTNTECKPTDPSIQDFGVAVTEESGLFPGVCAPRNGNSEPNCSNAACGATVMITNKATGAQQRGFISGICPAEHSVNAAKSPNPCPRGAKHVDFSRKLAMAVDQDAGQTNTFSVKAIP